MELTLKDLDLFANKILEDYDSGDLSKEQYEKAKKKLLD